MQGHLIPFVDFEPQWLGWRSLGLSPDTIGADSTVRDQFLTRFRNSAIVSVSASGLAVLLGSLTGYGLSRFGYQFGYMKNADISLLLHQPAHPAAGGPGAALPGALQGARRCWTRTSG